VHTAGLSESGKEKPLGPGAGIVKEYGTDPVDIAMLINVAPIKVIVNDPPST